jgi:hypothetical protein
MRGDREQRGKLGQDAPQCSLRSLQIQNMTQHFLIRREEDYCCFSISSKPSVTSVKKERKSLMKKIDDLVSEKRVRKMQEEKRKYFN